MQARATNEELMRQLRVTLFESYSFLVRLDDSTRNEYNKTQRAIDSLRLKDVRDAYDVFDFRSLLVGEYRKTTDVIADAVAQAQFEMNRLNAFPSYGSLRMALSRVHNVQRNAIDKQLRFTVVCDTIKHNVSVLSQTLREHRLNVERPIDFHFTAFHVIDVPTRKDVTVKLSRFYEDRLNEIYDTVRRFEEVGTTSNINATSSSSDAAAALQKILLRELDSLVDRILKGNHLQLEELLNVALEEQRQKLDKLLCERTSENAAGDIKTAITTFTKQQQRLQLQRKVNEIERARFERLENLIKDQKDYSIGGDDTSSPVDALLLCQRDMFDKQRSLLVELSSAEITPEQLVDYIRDLDFALEENAQLIRMHNNELESNLRAMQVDTINKKLDQVLRNVYSHSDQINSVQSLNAEMARLLSRYEEYQNTMEERDLSLDELKQALTGMVRDVDGLMKTVRTMHDEGLFAINDAFEQLTREMNSHMKSLMMRVEEKSSMALEATEHNNRELSAALSGLSNLDLGQMASDFIENYERRLIGLFSRYESNADQMEELLNRLRTLNADTKKGFDKLVDIMTLLTEDGSEDAAAALERLTIARKYLADIRSVV